MSRLQRLWLWLWLLVCSAVTACATTQPLASEGEGCEAPARPLSFEEACEDERSLLARKREYIKGNRGASKVEIFKYAGELIYEFRLSGTAFPYRPRVPPPPPSIQSD